MSDTAPSSAPAAAASTPAPAAPTQQPHHAQRQPREQGRFSGPPGEDAPAQSGSPASGEQAAPPPAPKKWNLGGREVTDPDELYAVAASKEVERRRLEELARKAEELEAFKARIEKDKRAAFSSPEEELQHALNLIRERMEEEALTPEQRAFRDERRRREALEKQLREREESEKQQREAQALQHAKHQVVQTVQAAMEATGLPQTDELARRVARKMHQNAKLGLNYPPEVLARQVRQEWTEETTGGLKKLSLQQKLELLPDLLTELDGLEDPTVLKKLGRLGERLRRLNLETLGASAAGPTSAPAAAAPANASGNPKPQSEWTPQDWEEEFARRAKR